MDEENSYTQISQAVQIIKTAILKSQEQTVKNVNADVLTLNYAIGGYISNQVQLNKWGSGTIKAISEQLQRELPGLRGFGYDNLKKMRQFYETWNSFLIGSPSATQLKEPANGSPTATHFMLPELTSKIFSSISDVNIAHDFISISFSHHMEILNKAKTLEERLFYIQKTAEYKWDKYRLRDLLKQDMYHHQATLPNNFLLTIPRRMQALKAIEMFKDEYLLDYINVEELAVRDESEVDEKVVENAIVHNVKKFIMTFGRDFSFIGNQYHLEKFGENHFIDLLFFNRELSCLVAVELKTGKFKPIYAGQLHNYLHILDDEVRKPHENPSIGIILCQDVNKPYVEYIVQQYDSPLGVATYKTAADMPEDLRKALPDLEDLKRIISDEAKDE